MKIYKPQIVIDLELFYGDLLFAVDQYPKVVDHLKAISSRLFEGIQNKHEPLYRELNNYHKGFIGKSIEELKSIDISLADCHDTIAQEYGFESWITLSKRTELKYNPAFEQSIHHLLAGHAQELKTLLQNNPGLVHERSPYGHQATLLHYAGSNGVEFWRQQVPLNLAEMIKIILAAGADKNATMQIYGGQHTTFEMLTTSAHPYEAGIINELKAIFEA